MTTAEEPDKVIKTHFISHMKDLVKINLIKRCSTVVFVHQDSRAKTARNESITAKCTSLVPISVPVATRSTNRFISARAPKAGKARIAQKTLTNVLT